MIRLIAFGALAVLIAIFWLIDEFFNGPDVGKD